MVTDRWTRKIVALLHDPPGKALVLRSARHTSHEQLAKALQRIALGRPASADEKDRAARADHIASAADRLNFPEGLVAYWDRVQPMLTHPLNREGKSHPIELPPAGLAALDDEVQRHAGQSIIQPWASRHGVDPQKLYLHLWRLLYEELATKTSLRHWIRWLPADTRQPDHSLEHHLSISAAIADALPHPAFLVFSVGPVQDFIAAARRTQDLWMGSWLLSYLSWKAMECLADRFGPDVVVFPSLRGQPLCDFWLSRQHALPCQPNADDLARPTLPNKFVALLHEEEAQHAAAQAEEAVKEEWKRLADRVYEALRTFFPADDETRRFWDRQTEQQLEVYWVVLPWLGSAQTYGEGQADAVIQAYRELLRPPEGWEFAKVYDVLRNSGQYKPNWGTPYSLIYDLADRAFGARKNLRDFRPGEEQREKCTVCGQRAALRSRQHQAKEFWKTVADNLHRQGRHDIKPNGDERLCAVCTVKRFAQREVLAEEFGLRGGFPSTNEVAAVRFKEHILDQLADARVSEALADFLRNAGHVPIPRTVAENAVPYLQKKAKDQLGRDLLKLDGEYLFTDTWTPEHLQAVNPDITEEEAEAKAQEGRRRLGRLYEVVGAPQPRKYYAILYMDGDHMGRWLSGCHRGLARFGDILHPEVRRALENDPQWSGILGQKRLITPAVHAAISGALANFSLKLVRWVIEERHAGRVVYAGGDDVLALLPVDDVLSAARELRALFSGEAQIKNGDLSVTFGDPTCTGYIVFGGEPLLTMGPTATASIGVAIAHHRHPLDLALQAARRAEKAAKETYGRNALAVEVLKRSGEALSVGTQFYSQDKSTDAVAILQEFCEELQAKKISAKFPHVLSVEVRTLEALPREAQKAELRRLLKRHAGEKLGREEKEKQAQEWAEKLLRLVAILEASHGNREKDFCDESKEKEDEEPPKPPGLERLSNWLLVCSFIVRGGEP